jgi:DNA/RNA endonuclease YhcR with UshA esterase domain
MEDKRYVVKEQSMRALADAIRDKAGMKEELTVDELVVATENIGAPPLEDKTITENGEYTSSMYGFGNITVDVQPETEEIIVTKAGTYIPTTYGYKKVVVDVPTRNFEEEEF